MHCHDGGVLQPGDDFCFALKAFPELNIVQQFLRQDFERHIAVKEGIKSEVDRGHPPTAQFLPDFITANFFWKHTVKYNDEKFRKQ
jgi:hypothetical protein